MTLRLIAFAFLLAMVLPASSAPAPDDSAVRAAVAERFPGVSAEDVRSTPIAGLYEVMVGAVLIYASADGRYVIKGDIIDLETERNLTKIRVAEAHRQALAQLDEDELIVFGPDDAKYTVTVFTDVSCGYCRALHKEIEAYNARGIRVRYAAFPRNGLASDAWGTMERVWCAEDRGEALTRAKRDKPFESAPCASTAVMEQWQLGRMLGVRGTPAIFTPTGRMIPGYLPPQELLKRLRQDQ